MFLRVLSRAGLMLKGQTWVLWTLCGLFCITLGVSAFAHWRHGEPLFPTFSPNQAQPIMNSSGCGQQLISQIAGQPVDVAQVHTCLSAMPRFASMSDAQFAAFAASNAPSAPHEFVLLGQTTGTTTSGKTYTVEVYLVRDGYPDTTYTLFLDEAGKIVNVA